MYSQKITFALGVLCFFLANVSAINSESPFQEKDQEGIQEEVTVTLQFFLQDKLPDGTMILFSNIATEDLLPGKHYLYLHTEELNSQLKAHTNTYFVIQETSK